MAKNNMAKNKNRFFLSQEIVKVMGAHGGVLTTEGITKYLNKNNEKILTEPILRQNVRYAVKYLIDRGIIKVVSKRVRTNTLRLSYAGEQYYKFIIAEEKINPGVHMKVPLIRPEKVETSSDLTNIYPKHLNLISTLTLKAMAALTVADDVIIGDTTTDEILMYINKYLLDPKSPKLERRQISSTIHYFVHGRGIVEITGVKRKSNLLTFTEKGLKFIRNDKKRYTTVDTLNTTIARAIPDPFAPDKDYDPSLDPTKQPGFVERRAPHPGKSIWQKQEKQEVPLETEKKDTTQHDVCDCWLKNPDEEIEDEEIENAQKPIVLKRIESNNPHCISKINIYLNQDKTKASIHTSLFIDITEISATELYENLFNVNISVGNTFLKPKKDKEPNPIILTKDDWEKTTL